jgi:TRAP-type C4-dicarboxylate transport system permease small subunit
VHNIAFNTLQFVAQGLPKVSFENTMANVLRTVFVIIALLSILFVAIGGFKYVTSAGSPEGVQSAKNTILYALIGLAVGISANIIISFVLAQLT